MRLILLELMAFFVLEQSGWAQPDTLWTRTYTYPPDFFPNAILWGHDGSIMVSGIKVGAASRDAFILKLNDQGNFVSLVEYGQPSMDEEPPALLCKTSDGGYAIATQSLTSGHSSNYYLARLDGSGVVIWERLFGVPPNDELLHTFITTSDGGFVMAGKGHWSFRPFAFRVNSEGDSLWAREYDFTTRGETYGIVQTADGGFAMTGYAAETLQYSQTFFAKTDSAGIVSQFRLFGGTTADHGKDLVTVNEGGYLLVGETDSYGDNVWDLFVLRLDENGDSLWSRIVACGIFNVATHCRELPDGSFLIQSICLEGPSYHLSLLHLTPSGETIWQRQYAVGGWFAHAGLDIDNSGRYLMSAERLFDTALIMLTEPDTTLAVLPPTGIPNDASLSITAYPNPFNAQVKMAVHNAGVGRVSIRMYDVLGRKASEALTDVWIRGDYQFTFDASNLAAGIYFIQATTGEEHAVAKIILVK